MNLNYYNNDIDIQICPNSFKKNYLIYVLLFSGIYHKNFKT